MLYLTIANVLYHNGTTPEHLTLHIIVFATKAGSYARTRARTHTLWVQNRIFFKSMPTYNDCTFSDHTKQLKVGTTGFAEIWLCQIPY